MMGSWPLHTRNFPYAMSRMRDFRLFNQQVSSKLASKSLTPRRANIHWSSKYESTFEVGPNRYPGTLPNSGTDIV